MAPVFVYILARGYAALHYVVASVLPFLAMMVPVDRPKHVFERYLTRGLAFFVLWTGMCPLAIFAVAKTSAKIEDWRNRTPLPVSHLILVGIDGNNIEFPNVDGNDQHHQLCWLNQGLEFDFAQPVSPSEMRLATDHVQIQNVKGVNIWWATETQMRGIITLGTIEYSYDGKHFEAPREFRNTITYAAYPVTIQLPRADRLVRAIRLRAKELYNHHDQWVDAQVDFY